MSSLRENGLNNNNSSSDVDTPNASKTGKVTTPVEASLVEVKGKRFIPESQVKKIILRVIVLLNPDSQLRDLPCNTHCHANVAGGLNDLKVLVNSIYPWSSLDVYKQDVATCAGSNSLQHRSMTRMLQQIASGVEHLHRVGRPHGNLVASGVLLSCDDRNHPIILDSNVPCLSNTKDVKEKDVRDLGRLFYLVLTKGKTYDPQKRVDISDIKCDEAATAVDLLEKMLTEYEPMSIEKVLEHPLFWDDAEKAKFIIDIFDSVKPKRDSIKDLEKDAKKTVFHGKNWKEGMDFTASDATFYDRTTKTVVGEKLFGLAGGDEHKKTFAVYFYNKDKDKLFRIKGVELCQEIKKMIGNDQESADYSENIRHRVKKLFKGTQEDQYTIVGLYVLVETEQKNYDTNSFYDFLGFFRNTSAHFWEKDSELREYIEMEGGYWNYFSSRFPNFLQFVYNNRKSFPFYQNTRRISHATM